MRYKKYNDGVATAKKYEREGKVLIIAPDDCCGMRTLTKSVKRMDQMYRKGYNDAFSLQQFLHNKDINNTNMQKFA
jgi:predicted patatin/cPLA2 family phospholipase